MISVQRLEELRLLREDLAAASHVLARELSDTGHRTDLDDAIAAFGFDRADLEAELDADLAAEKAARPRPPQGQGSSTSR